MGKNFRKKCRRICTRGNAMGFSLIELLITIVVGSIALASIYSVYASQTKTYSNQREITRMQQNLRAAMFLIKNDIRNSGRIGMRDSTVGITNVGRVNPDADDARGYPSISMSTCFDDPAAPDGQAEIDNIQNITYQVGDWDGDGIRELRRQVILNGVAGTWDLVFDGIEDIGFAYAYDFNPVDMDLDRRPVVPPTVIWGIDTDNVIGLDTNVDNIPDGNIDINDDGDGDGWIDTVDGGLGTQIPLANIRAVRIWLLARSLQPNPKYVDFNVYVMGHKVLDMNDAANINRRNLYHCLLTGAVALQNFALSP